MPRVLICDDAVAFGTLLSAWLREGGIDEVVHARTVQEALSFAEQHEPDVVVVDHLLPDGSSQELVPRLRAVTPGAKVLLISGMPGDRLAAAAAAVGADAHIAKAATSQAMRDAVMGLLD